MNHVLMNHFGRILLRVNKLFFFILFTPFYLYSQIVIQNDSNNERLPYVRINYLLNDKIIDFAYSNEEGQFEIFNELNFEKIEFLYVGFENKTIYKEDLQKIKKIYLNPLIYQLEEVIVKKDENKYFDYGYCSKKQTNEIWLKVGSIYTEFIENNLSEKKVIKNFKFKIGSKVKEENFILKLHFYKVFDKKPSDELDYGNIFYKVEKGSNGFVSIDVLEKNIVFPLEGICIGLELIENERYDASKRIFHKKECLVLDMFTNTGKITFSRGEFSDKWFYIMKTNYKNRQERFDLMYGLDLINFD